MICENGVATLETLQNDNDALYFDLTIILR